MYAIVKTGGKQYRVEQGQTLLVERLPEPEGATVNLETLLYRSEEAVFDADSLAKIEVQATIVTHLRGKKLRVFKFKPKRGYRRRTGHRQELTRIEVTKIGARSAARAAAAKPAADPAEAASPPRAARPRAAAAAAGGETAPPVRAPRARAAKPDAAEAAAPKPRAPRRSAAAKTDATDAPAEASKEDTDGA
jgi:large subunit ribosomal protein L21